MPFPNEHSCRQRDPGEFDEKSFKSKEIAPGVRIIVGKLKTGDGAMVTQTYRLNVSHFPTVREAKDWLKTNDVTCKSFEAAVNSKNMDNAILKIYGDIGSDENADNISAKSVAMFLDQNKNATNITVKINSRGGDVQEGWAITDLLMTSGKQITTIGEGKIYSIATIIFLAGQNREIMANADGLIHNPFIPPFTLADQYESDDLIKIAESLKQEEAKILDFYATRTGTPKDKLAEYMSNDTKLSADDMLSLGFATKIIEPVKAYAYYNFKKQFIMDEKDVKTFGEKIDAILDRIKNLSRLEPFNQTITDKDGKKLTLTKPTGDPVVGDEATPDGEFIMADGKKITVQNGKITEIGTPMAEKSELELANEKIAELQAKIDEKEKALQDNEKEKANLVTAEASFKSKEAEAKAMIDELTNLKNSWKPESRNHFGNVDKVGDIDLIKVREFINSKKE